MKKIFFAIMGMALFMCGCTSPVDPTNSISARGYVLDKGFVNSNFSYYDFTKENPGCNLSGFSGREDFGRWSSEDTAVIELHMLPNTEYTARLEILKVILPDEPLEFDVEANGNVLSHVSTNGGVSFVNVSKEFVAEDGTSSLMLIFKNATQPSKYYPGNQDQRKLGLILKSITVYGYTEIGMEKTEKRNN